MKKVLPFLVYSLFLTNSCTAPGEPLDQTVTPMVLVTTSPPTAEIPPTPQPSPTAETVDTAPYVKYTEIPTGIEGFQEFTSVSDIFTKLYPALDEMDKQGLLPKLDPNSPPVIVDLVADANGNIFKVNLGCNLDGAVNCVPIAFVKIGEKYVTILKIKNSDNTESKFAWWNGGWWGQRRLSRIIDNVLADPTELRIIEIFFNPGGPNDDNDTIKRYLDDQVFEDAMMQWAETQTYPRDYKNIIPANTFQ